MKIHDTIRLTTGAAIVAAALSACSPTASPDLDHARQVAATCPTDGQQVAAQVASDESGSRRGSTAQPTQQAVIRNVAERTAICGGHLRVVLFAGSVVTAPVYDSDLRLEGATDTARLRKAANVTDAVMNSINEALPSALSSLSDDGQTDIVGQLGPAEQYVSQLAANGHGFQLDTAVLTDGIQTAQVNLADPSLTVEQARELASALTVPDLSGAHVRIVGIGRQADGEQLPTPYVEALRAFHQAVCVRTKAVQCTAVTDAAGA